MIDGSVLQSAQRCFEKKSRVVVKMVVTNRLPHCKLILPYVTKVCNNGTTKSMAYTLSIINNLVTTLNVFLHFEYSDEILKC